MRRSTAMYSPSSSGLCLPTRSRRPPPTSSGEQGGDRRVRFASDWTLQATLVNAFDKGYETGAYYHQPGREFGLGLRWQPK